MELNTEFLTNNIESIYFLSQKALENIPTLESENDYWFVRAKAGTFYQSFLVGNYIAIGWNEITLKNLEQMAEENVKEKILKHNPESEKPGAAYNQMRRFAYNIKIDDLVIVPSEAPNDLLVGKVISRPYTETDDNILSETNVCTFSKRIKVKWLGKIRNSDIDPELYKLLYSGHTISNANQYKKYINRGVYDAYIEDDIMSITIKVQDEESINAYDYNYFLTKVLEIAAIFSEEEEQRITLRTNVQSQGPIELLSNPVVMENLSLILEWVLNLAKLGTVAWAFKKLLKAGGEISFNKENGFSAKINSQAEANKTNAEARSIDTDNDIKKWREAIKIVDDERFIQSATSLKIKTPEQIANAVQETLNEIKNNNDDID